MGITYRQAERLYRVYPRLNSKLLQDLIKDNLSLREVDEEFLKWIIDIGCESREAAVLLEKSITDKHTMANWVSDLLCMDWHHAKLEYHYKPRIIECIIAEVSSKEMSGIFNSRLESEHNLLPDDIKSVFSPKLITENAIYPNIKKIWASSYSFFTSQGKKYKAFFDYLRRIYMVYPKINARLLDELQLSSATPREIDAEFLKILLYKGYSTDDLIKILKFTSKVAGIDASTTKYARLYILNVLGLGVHEANDQYYWKPRFLSYLIKYKHFDFKMMANNPIFNCSENTIRSAIKRVWSEDYNRIKRRHPKDAINHLVEELERTYSTN